MRTSADEGVCSKGTHRVSGTSQGAQNTRAGEIDGVGDVHRLEQTDRGRDTEAGLVDFQGAAVEGDRPGAEGTRIGNAHGGVAVDGGTERVGVRGVEDHRAAIADEVGTWRAGDCAHDHRVGSGEDRAIHLECAAAGTETIRAACSRSQRGGGVVTTGSGTEEDPIVWPEGTEVEGGAEADHVDTKRAVD